MLRFKILSVPLMKAFESVDKKTDGKPFTIPLKGQEALYIVPYSDRVMVSYGLAFEDPSDAVLSKIFLQVPHPSEHFVRNL